MPHDITMILMDDGTFTAELLPTNDDPPMLTVICKNTPEDISEVVRMLKPSALKSSLADDPPPVSPPKTDPPAINS